MKPGFLSRFKIHFRSPIQQGRGHPTEPATARTLQEDLPCVEKRNDTIANTNRNRRVTQTGKASQSFRLKLCLLLQLLE